MKFKNYTNPHTQDNRIYSKSEMLDMTIREIKDRAKELTAQYRVLGLPDEKEHPGFMMPQMQGLNGPIKNIMDEIKPEFSHVDARYSNMPNYLSGIKANDNQEENPWESSEYQLDGRIEKTNIPVIDKIKDSLKKYEDLDAVTAAQKAGSKVPFPNPIEKDYYGLQAHLNDGEKIPQRVLDENNIFKYGEIEDKLKAQKYTKDLAKMYGFDPNDPNIEELLKNKVIVEPKTDSRISQYIKNSDTMQKWIADNYDRLKSGDIHQSESVQFPMENKLDKENRGLHLTLNKVGIDDIRFNEDGSMSYVIKDSDDYEYQNKTGEYKKDFSKDINNRAYKQQEVGQLEKFFFTIPQTLTKEELEEILKRYKKKW